MAVARDRERTLDEAKAYLRERLASRTQPLHLVDQVETAWVIDQLDGLDGERWGRTWGAAGARFEEQARAAEARDDAPAARAAYLQAYNFYFLGRFPCPNHPRKLECAEKARECFVRAGRYFDPPLERIVIPFAGRADEGTEIVFYLRKPPGAARNTASAAARARRRVAPP